MAVTETSRMSRQRGSERSSHNGDLIALDTPVVSLHLHRPHMPRMPRMPQMKRMTEGTMQETARAVETARTFLPPPERMLYYGALGALAVFGLVEWPVAAAIGAGTMIAQRARRGGMERQEQGIDTERAMKSPARAATSRSSRATTSRSTGTTGTTRARSASGGTTRSTGTTRARSTGTTGTTRARSTGTTGTRARAGTSRAAASKTTGATGTAGTSGMTGTSSAMTARSTSAPK